jgi:hypothetical protein
VGVWVLRYLGLGSLPQRLRAVAGGKTGVRKVHKNWNVHFASAQHTGNVTVPLSQPHLTCISFSSFFPSRCFSPLPTRAHAQTPLRAAVSLFTLPSAGHSSEPSRSCVPCRRHRPPFVSSSHRESVADSFTRQPRRDHGCLARDHQRPVRQGVRGDTECEGPEGRQDRRGHHVRCHVMG